MIKAKCLEFIDQLLNIFEEKKVIYKRLIYLHHFVRNMTTDDELVTILCRYISDRDISDKVKRRDNRFLNGTRFELDAELMWSELTTTNKEIIWKWLDNILLEFN